MHPCFSGKIDHRSDPLHEYLTTYLLHRRTRKLSTKDHKRERGVVNTADLGLKLVVKSSDYSTTRDPQEASVTVRRGGKGVELEDDGGE